MKDEEEGLIELDEELGMFRSVQWLMTS